MDNAANSAERIGQAKRDFFATKAIPKSVFFYSGLTVAVLAFPAAYFFATQTSSEFTEDALQGNFGKHDNGERRMANEEGSLLMEDMESN